MSVFAADPNVMRAGDKGIYVTTKLIAEIMLRRGAPEDIHARLNREMWRMRFGGWFGFFGTLAVVAVVRLGTVQVPIGTNFKLGEVTGVMSHLTETGAVQQIGILVDGQNRSAGTRARLLHPATGEIICLRETTYWPFGRVTLGMTDMRFCNGTIPTSRVE
jgi:hypothetical protein